MFCCSFIRTLMRFISMFILMTKHIWAAFHIHIQEMWCTVGVFLSLCKVHNCCEYPHRVRVPFKIPFQPHTILWKRGDTERALFICIHKTNSTYTCIHAQSIKPEWVMTIWLILGDSNGIWLLCAVLASIIMCAEGYLQSHLVRLVRSFARSLGQHRKYFSITWA